MADTAKIKTALEQMNPDDDTQWLTDGKARMSVVEGVVGSTGITRTDVEEAWPGFGRDVLEAHLAAQIADMTGDTALDAAVKTTHTESLSAGLSDEDIKASLEQARVDMMPRRVYEMPEAYGGEVVNDKAGPLSAKLCEMQEGDEPMSHEFLYGVWMEQRVYSVERTTNGYKPVFPKFGEHE
jgi:hypothetical protein